MTGTRNRLDTCPGNIDGAIPCRVTIDYNRVFVLFNKKRMTELWAQFKQICLFAAFQRLP